MVCSETHRSASSGQDRGISLKDCMQLEEIKVSKLGIPTAIPE